MIDSQIPSDWPYMTTLSATRLGLPRNTICVSVTLFVPWYWWWMSFQGLNRVPYQAVSFTALPGPFFRLYSSMLKTPMYSMPLIPRPTPMHRCYSLRQNTTYSGLKSWWRRLGIWFSITVSFRTCRYTSAYWGMSQWLFTELEVGGHFLSLDNPDGWLKEVRDIANFYQVAAL